MTRPMYKQNGVEEIREEFDRLLTLEKFQVDKNGGKILEIVGASFIADEDNIFGTPNEGYIRKELAWYDSRSTNINDINPNGEPPAAWKMTANKHGEINSNYGLLIDAEKYHYQFEHAMNALVNDYGTRRSVMVYTRPSIQWEYNENGKSDFICTNAVNYRIVDGYLNATVQMRSNDAIYGYKNDLAWQEEVMHRLIEAIDDPAVKFGSIYWQAASLHIYERHFHLIKV